MSEESGLLEDRQDASVLIMFSRSSTIIVFSTNYALLADNPLTTGTTEL